MHPSGVRAHLVGPLLFAFGSLGAQTPDPAPATPPAGPVQPGGAVDRPGALPALLLDDTRQVLGSRRHWDDQDWTLALGGAAVVLGTALFLDNPVDKAMVKQPAGGTWDHIAKAVEPFGSAPGVGIAVGLYLGGAAFANPEVKATGTDAMLAIAIAELAITFPLKELVGRARPYENEGTHSFHPFHGGQSFPSGHTTIAFALASVVSFHSESAWVSGVSYGIAGLVGLARVEQRDHFLSDVVAGGLIGTFVGRVVVVHNQALRSAGPSKVAFSFTPLLLDGGFGLRLVAQF